MINLLVDVFSISLSLVFILLISFSYSSSSKFKSKKISRKLLFTALTVKILATILFCLFYKFLYDNGGDTFSYHKDAKLIAGYLLNDSQGFFELIMRDEQPWLANNYTYSSVKPVYWFNNYEFNLVRLVVPFEIISLGNFYACSLWISFLAFTGVWKLFEMLSSLFSKDKKLLSLILFFPSVLFWTSGILKDSFIIASVCGIVYSVYNLAHLKKPKFRYLLITFSSVFVILLLKPYVLIALIPCIFLWAMLEFLTQKRSKFSRAISTPIYLCVSIFLIGSLLIFLQKDLGVYGKYSDLLEYSTSVRKGFNSINKVDLIGIDSFDFESSESIGGILFSTFSIIHRPFIWESWNVFSLITGIENLLLLVVCIYGILSFLFDLKSLRIFLTRPFLIFCIFYSLVLAMGIGLSITNFGAIIRLKSAFMLFYLIPFIVLIGSAKRNLKLSPSR